MILLLLLLFGSSQLHPTQGHPTVQCVQTGAGFLTPDSLLTSWHLRRGSFTIGAERFDSLYGGAMSSAFSTYSAIRDVFKDSSGYEKLECQYTWHKESTHEVQLCDEHDALLKLKVNAVQQTDASGTKHTLAGWLHFEVELVDPTDSIRMVYAQMCDEYFNAVGEFVTDPAEQCSASAPETFLTPSLYQYLPCSAIGAREEKASQALYMVHSGDLIDKSLKGSKYLPPADLNRGVHFTWRMNEYWCSRHYRITPHIFILTSKNIVKWKETTKNGTLKDTMHFSLLKQGDWKLYRKTPNQQLLPDWFGAADIKHPKRGLLQCINPIFKGPAFNETLTREAPWIQSLYKRTVEDEFFYPKNLRPVATVAL